MTAAYLLQRAYDVTLYEAQPRLGGHAHTHDVIATGAGEAGDRVVSIDSGFIVHNDRTYPNLLRLFAELGVDTQDSDMSMSVRCDGCGLEYAGARGLGGIFAQPANAANPRFLRMLVEVKRFHRHAHRVLRQTDDEQPDGTNPATLGAFIESGRYSPYFVRHFLVPLVSCVWSCPPETALAYPARYLFEFLDHHGALQVTGSPQWRTVVAGSARYVERIAKELPVTVVGTPVRSVARVGEGAAHGPGGGAGRGVEIRDAADRVDAFERVVVATHADEALALLAAPRADERAVLGAFGYSANETVLHTDATLLPRSRRARASWNYRLDRCEGDTDHVQVSYHMNRLHRLSEPTDYVVTLNGQGRIRADSVIARMRYTHPIYTPASVAAQAKLASLNDDRLAFAGAYHGWGFHEDGCRSGVQAAAALGVRW